jgi:hypothetical protein
LHNSTAGASTAIGDYALETATGNQNTAVGYQALQALTTGGNNLAIGLEVGSVTLATGSNNILIGTSDAVDTPAANTSNYLNIGNAIYGPMGGGGPITIATALTVGSSISSTLNLPGIPASSNIDDFVCWNTSTLALEKGTTACQNTSLRKWKQDFRPITGAVSEVMALKPTEYRFKPEYKRGNALHVGFIAEDVEAVDPRIAAYKDNGELEGVEYDRITAIDTAAIQEMHKEYQERFQEQQREIDDLMAQLKALQGQ